MLDLVPIVAILSFFGTLSGIFYLRYITRYRERMALLEKGVTADVFKGESDKNSSLKWGLVAVGSGIGLLIGNTLKVMGLAEEVAFFSMLLICGGAGLLLYYMWPTKKNDFPNS